jgi:hypothetical protein
MDELVYVCLACGKMSHDRNGEKPISRGWDVSCMINSVLCKRSKLVVKDDRVVSVKSGGMVEGKPVVVKQESGACRV